MSPIFIGGTGVTPTVAFQNNGLLFLKGRSMSENVSSFYNILIEFAQEIACSTVQFSVDLEYFNTASSKKLTELFHALEINENIKDVKIHWYFDEEDEDSLDTAQLIEEIIPKSEFIYHMHAKKVTPNTTKSSMR